MGVKPLKNTKRIAVDIAVCTVILIVLWFVYAAILYMIPSLPVKAKIAIALAFIIPTVLLVGVTGEKVKEVRSGEEDDLGKY